MSRTPELVCAKLPCRWLVSNAMLLNVFGRDVEIVRQQGAWLAYYRGNEGKRRLAKDILIPESLCKTAIPGYISDLCHEWASVRHPAVVLLRD